jgi:hypothetical protein
MTAFIITKDHIADPDQPAGTNLNAAGVVGPSAASDADVARLKAGEGIPFRLLDDDGNVYYEGRRLEESDADPFYDGEPELAPLDCFGTPNAGAVSQQERNAAGRRESIN